MVVEFGLNEKELELLKNTIGGETCEGGPEQETG